MNPPAGNPGVVPAAPAADSRRATYGRNFSYFSHRVFVVHQPGELHDYLHRLLDTDGSDKDNDDIEIELARWLLLHRSELSPLALNRLVATWRGSGPDLAVNQQLLVPGQDGARSKEYRPEITMQFAIELELARSHHARWLQERPHLQQARLDAAYYLSRHWPEQDREKSDQAAAGAPEYHIDLQSSDGRDTFFRYLEARLNLQDDTPAPDSDKGNSAPKAQAPDPRQALSPQERAWLLAIAQAVAARLSRPQSADEWKANWLAAAGGAVRLTYGKVPEPSGALFKHLLSDSDTVLEAIVEAGKPSAQRYRWRYLRSGERSASAEALALAQEASTPRDLIAAAETLLNRALWGSRPPAAAVPLVALLELADSYRVLPTSPKWASVAQARQAMKEAEEGFPGIDLPAHKAELAKYAQQLCRPEVADAIAHALPLAAALAGLRGEATGPAGEGEHPNERQWRDALSLLREGLDFDECPPARVSERLRAAYADLRGLLPALPEIGDGSARTAAPGSNHLPWPADLAELVAASFGAARAAGRVAVADEQIAREAWPALQRRLQALARGASDAVAASGAELLAAARCKGLVASLMLRPDRLQLRQWTGVLIAALGAESAKAAPAPFALPGVLAVHALERMGLSLLRPDEQEVWLGALTPHHDGAEQLLLYAREHLPAQAGSLAFAAAIVVGADDRKSISDHWPLPPRQAFTLRATAAELDTLLRLRLDMALGASRELRIAWESEAARKALMPFGPLERLRHGPLDRLRAGLASQARDHAAAPLRELWLGPPPSASGPTPRVVAPGSADDLWVELPLAGA